MTQLRIILLCPVLLVALACGAPAGMPSAAGAALTGAGEPVVDLAGLGLIRISNSMRECSGVLITHNYAITAEQCLCDTDEVNVATVHIEQGAFETQALGINLDNTNDVYTTKKLDIALIRTARMLPLSEPQKLWEGTAADLVGRTLACYGHGDAPAGVSASVLDARSDLGFPSVSTGCSTPRAVDGVEIELPAGVALEPEDTGGPCFVQVGDERYLAGFLSMTSPADPTHAFVQTVDQRIAWLGLYSDIWSRSACEAAVPDTQFALDPQLFMGVPTADGLTVVSRHAFDEPDEPRTVIKYNSGYRFGAWTTVAPPPLTRGVRALVASADPDDNPYGATYNLLEVMYTDADHELHVMWNDLMGTREWLQREQIEATEPLVAFDGVGPRFSPARPRAGLDNSVRLPLFVNEDGRVATSRYIDTTQGWVDMPLPDSAPLADARKRPTLIMHAFNGDLLAGYRNLSGEFVIHRGNLELVDTDGESSPWYDAPSVTTDLPASVRDVSLAVTTIPLDEYWAVTTDQDGQMRLYALDLTTGHATDYGRIAGTAFSTVKTLPYLPLFPHQQLFISYTGDDWAAHVRPAVNCLGNDPPGF